MVKGRLALGFLLLSVPAAALNAPLVARIDFRPPEAAVVDETNSAGVYQVSWEPHSGMYIDLSVYSWFFTAFSDGPQNAQEFLKKLEMRAGYDDFNVVAPIAPTTFQGQPAWTITRTYSLTRRVGRPGKTQVKDWTMAVQRRWGYVVVKFSDDPVFFDEDKAKLDQFLQSVKLLPEPPMAPRTAVGLLGAVIVGLGIGGVGLLRRRRLARAGS